MWQPYGQRTNTAHFARPEDTMLQNLFTHPRIIKFCLGGFRVLVLWQPIQKKNVCTLQVFMSLIYRTKSIYTPLI